MPETKILLDWTWDSDSDSLQAPSAIFHDEGVPLNYCIEKRSATWDAFFEGVVLKTGTLEQCIAACLRSERQAKSSLKAYRDHIARRRLERGRK
jgi:hypothetical protein